MSLTFESNVFFFFFFKPLKLTPVFYMALQTISACSPALQTTNCLFFLPL